MILAHVVAVGRMLAARRILVSNTRLADASASHVAPRPPAITNDEEKVR